MYDDKELNQNYLSINSLDEINDKNILDSLLLINDVMGKGQYNQNPQRFFEVQIKESIENKKNNLEGFLIAFLKMFDTFNFINLTPDISTKNRLLLARKIAALSFYHSYPAKLELQNKLISCWNALMGFGWV